MNKFKNMLLPLLVIFMILNMNGCSGVTMSDVVSGNIPTNDGQKVFLEAWSTIKDQYLDKTDNAQDWGKWKNRYFREIKTKDDAYVAINTMLESLNDPYTRFLPPSAFKEQNLSIDAKVYGIGVNISDVDHKITVVGVIDGTPAKKADLKPGDIILKVNNVNVSGLDLGKVADMVRGKAGTKVTLVILRDKKKTTKVITRKEIDIKSVYYKMLDKKYAYIQIVSFISQETPKEFSKALEETKSAKGIIIDLRGNTGGLLPNAVLISDMFLKKGIIVSIVGRNGDKEVIKAEAFDTYSDKPLVVLIDKGSASASEIMSGALQDNHRAKLVGTTSFGKGLVQKIQDLSDGSGINVTIAKYLTPDGRDINKKGIQPDVKVEITKADYLKHRDSQLKMAKQVLDKEIIETGTNK